MALDIRRMTDLELFIVDKNDTSWSLRPWLLLVHHGIPFTETSFVAADPETPARIAAVSPNGRVPALRVGQRVVWESLAIVETIAELFPDLAIWPREALKRMHARSIAAEMHAGFFELRRHCTMNLALRTRISLDPARRAELSRFERMVESARTEAGAGPFLFGDFSAADAMLAPVATRIVSYGLEVGAVTRAWIDAIFALPAFARWRREAEAELTVRPVAARIGKPLGKPVSERIPAGPSYAVIFTSTYRGEHEASYGERAQRIRAIAESMPGYQGFFAASAPDGQGVAISYWDSLDAIAKFRAESEHVEAQNAGRARFYSAYDLRVARIERRVTFEAERSPARVEDL